MCKEAEKYAEDDKKTKEVIESCNQADQLIYSMEKTLKDYGDKISDDDKKKIEEAKDKLMIDKGTLKDKVSEKALIEAETKQ